MSNDWETGICGCCDVKDCGCGCCLKLYCGSMCIWGSAMEKAGLGGNCTCCVAYWLFPCCTLCQGRASAAQKYGIAEDGIMSAALSLCCCSCSYLQVVNQILVKENSTWGCCGVEAGGAPEGEVMAR